MFEWSQSHPTSTAAASGAARPVPPQKKKQVASNKSGSAKTSASAGQHRHIKKSNQGQRRQPPPPPSSQQKQQQARRAAAPRRTGSQPARRAPPPPGPAAAPRPSVAPSAPPMEQDVLSQKKVIVKGRAVPSGRGVGAKNSAPRQEKATPQTSGYRTGAKNSANNKNSTKLVEIKHPNNDLGGRIKIEKSIKTASDSSDSTTPPVAVAEVASDSLQAPVANVISTKPSPRLDHDPAAASTISFEDAASYFTYDLYQYSSSHINFLRSCHQAGLFATRPSDESFRRYSDIWLPLIAKASGDKKYCDGKGKVKLVPPIDVAWLWHCHRLAPARYAEHMRKKFGCAPIGPATPFERHGRSTSLKDLPNVSSTLALWADEYPDEPFFIDNDIAAPASSLEKMEQGTSRGTLHGFDVIDSATRQATFLWQISTPLYSDPDFLRNAVINYYRFLLLRKVQNQENATSAPANVDMIVPTFQIDLIWHTHIACSIPDYNRDCFAIIGERFNHDDSYTDREEGSDLDVGFKSTCDLWQRTYETEYTVQGAMYRGEPPPAYFTPPSTIPTATVVSTAPGLLRGWVNEEHELPAPAPTSATSRACRPWMSIDAPRAFQAATAAPGRQFALANQMKPGYMFGNKDPGYGYYSLSTREGYEIFAARLLRKAKSTGSWQGPVIISFVAIFISVAAGLVLSLLLIPAIVVAGVIVGNAVYWYTAHKEEEKIKGYRDVVDARSKLEERRGEVNVPSAPVVQCNQDGSWITPPAWLNAAACGAIVKNSGGGCGGGCGGYYAGCGAAACGGGGW